MRVQNLLIRMLKKELKSQGVKVQNFTAKDLETIAYEWVKEGEAFIAETIATDITENPKLYALAKRRKALIEDDDYE